MTWANCYRPNGFKDEQKILDRIYETQKLTGFYEKHLFTLHSFNKIRFSVRPVFSRIALT